MANQQFLEIRQLEDFLRTPPLGFSVETVDSMCTLVTFDSNSSCVFIDDFASDQGKVTFRCSQGRQAVIKNLTDYTIMRRKITSQRIYLLAYCSRFVPKAPETREISGVGHFIVSLNGSHPFVRWQIEQALDQTISSVAGENYVVEIDLCQALHSWVNSRKATLSSSLTEHCWRDCSFTLKYQSDALFDFPFWLGFSRRRFEIKYK